jgi:putative ABC transport system substrate-binding protein
MRRRGFITLLGAAAAWPLAARARDTSRLHRIGFIGPERRLKMMQQGLAELGYALGKDIVIEYRPSDQPDRLSGFAKELVAKKVDVIVASGSQSVRAVQQVTQTIPIVMTGSSDPVGTRFVETLSRPGGNITGFSLQSPELSGKRLALLREIDGGLSRVAVLWNPDDPPAVFSLKETENAARSLDLDLHSAVVRQPEDFDNAFASSTQSQCGAVVVLPASLMTRNARRIAELALVSRLPSISYFKEFAEQGGLIAYGPSLDDLSRRSAGYVDKILNGANPADLPVEQPVTFEMVINVRTAKALGLEVPTEIITRANDVIE